MSSSKLKVICILTGALFMALLSVRIYNTHRYHLEKQMRFMMDTYVSIYAVGPKKISSRAINSAFERIKEIDLKFNQLNPQSPIYAFNNKGQPLTDPEVLGLVRVALEASRQSDGAFDITVEPLVRLWGFYAKDYYVPKDGEIKDYLNKVGYQHLILDDGKLDKDNPGTKIDLGGIAKGYALAEAAKVLRAEGITCALIDAGGDVYTLGKKGKRPWRVGIKDPRQEGILGYVEVEDLAVIGSGDYERFFIQDGRRYHHIFNPKTGYPTEGLSSVTVIYHNPVVAQAWAKIPFVLGAKKGLGMSEKIPGMEAIVVTSSGEILYSSGLKHTLNIIKN